jgi:hypothetical protein
MYISRFPGPARASAVPVRRWVFLWGIGNAEIPGILQER